MSLELSPGSTGHTQDVISVHLETHTEVHMKNMSDTNLPNRRLTWSQQSLSQMYKIESGATRKAVLMQLKDWRIQEKQ